MTKITRCDQAGQVGQVEIHDVSRPILFSSEMVQALLDGRKTQTRRLIKPQPDRQVYRISTHPALYAPDDGTGAPWWNRAIKCPYGVPGDRLWVRESWTRNVHGEILFLADWKEQGFEYEGMGWKWGRSLRKADARLWLTITDVRAEHLQVISEPDAQAEGVKPFLVNVSISEGGDTSYRAAFSELWNRLNAERGYGWDVQPWWVWVISFKVALREPIKVDPAEEIEVALESGALDLNELTGGEG